MYQVRFALYLAFKKLPEVSDPEQYNISIEKLDDVAFDKEGSAIELLQTKFHGPVGNLTDRSPDIWKTVRVWLEAIKSGDITLGQATLSLITTQSLPENSIAYYLSSESGRNIEKALKVMQEICVERNKTNQKGYDAFQALSDVQQKAFVNDIYIVGKSDNLTQIGTKISGYGRQYVASEKVSAFIERVEGIWFKWCVESLNDDFGVINLEGFQELLDKLRPEYTETNLPAEFTEELPNLIDIEHDTRTFVQQLRLFNAPKKLIEQAIVYYFRAFEQRTKWINDGLVQPGELNGYNQRLHEQWDEHQSFVELFGEIRTEQNKREYSAKLYKECIQNGVIPIRKDFIEAYVAKGSYHILSDELKIGWHPDYIDMLKGDSDEDVA